MEDTSLIYNTTKNIDYYNSLNVSEKILATLDLILMSLSENIMNINSILNSESVLYKVIVIETQKNPIQLIYVI